MVASTPEFLIGTCPTIFDIEHELSKPTKPWDYENHVPKFRHIFTKIVTTQHPNPARGQGVPEET